MINIIFFLLVGLGILLSLYRLIKGNTQFDRVVSLDVINVCIIGVLVVIAVITKNELYVDVAIVYSILGFLETIVFAKFLEVRS
jgi:multicomponent Na+:H+ antiporter subunit F